MENVYDETVLFLWELDLGKHNCVGQPPWATNVAKWNGEFPRIRGLWQCPACHQSSTSTQLEIYAALSPSRHVEGSFSTLTDSSH